MTTRQELKEFLGYIFENYQGNNNVEITRNSLRFKSDNDNINLAITIPNDERAPITISRNNSGTRSSEHLHLKNQVEKMTALETAKSIILYLNKGDIYQEFQEQQKERVIVEQNGVEYAVPLEKTKVRESQRITSSNHDHNL